jgi:hypothetical protein
MEVYSRKSSEFLPALGIDFSVKSHGPALNEANQPNHPSAARVDISSLK